MWGKSSRHINSLLNNAGQRAVERIKGTKLDKSIYMLWVFSGYQQLCFLN